MNDFEDRVYRRLKGVIPQGSRLFLCVSGGVDSMVMVHVLLRIRRALKVELAVIHVHHGPGENSLLQFRNTALQFVRDFCAQNELPFYTNPPETKTRSSEQDLRRLRMDFIHEICVSHGSEPFFVCTGHNQTDLFETRLLRLIRGCGSQGFVSMSFRNEKKLRPLLDESRAMIESYGRERKIEHLDDPSNASTDPLRNWLRHSWLPSLCEKSPGADRAFANSLEHLASQMRKRTLSPESFVQNGAVNRQRLQLVSLVERKEILAFYLNSLGIKNYSQGHINELLRRLDSPKKDFNFNMLKRMWIVSSSDIKTSSS